MVFSQISQSKIFLNYHVMSLTVSGCNFFHFIFKLKPLEGKFVTFLKSFPLTY
jgi:hypothetical protein